jgi:hypothetical protein
VVELGHELLLHACELNKLVLELCHRFPQAWLSVVLVIMEERAVHIDPGRASGNMLRVSRVCMQPWSDGQSEIAWAWSLQA